MKKRLNLLLLAIPFITFAQGPWEFNTPSNTEGWTSKQGNSGAAGTVIATGTDLNYVTLAKPGGTNRNPIIENLTATIDGDAFNAVEIRLKNGTGSTYLRFNDGAYSALVISANDTEYQTYVFPTSVTGTIASVFFEFKNNNASLNGGNYVPASEGLQINIDYIRPTNIVVPIQNSFNFGTTTEGFTQITRADVLQATESLNGALQITANSLNRNNYKVALDPVTANVDGTTNKYAHITLKNTSTNDFFTLSGLVGGVATTFSPFQTFTASDSEYTTYDFDLTTWDGNQQPELAFGVKDNWDSLGVYAIDDQVVSGNSMYKNLTGVNNNDPVNFPIPRFDTANWVLVGVEGDVLDLVNSIYIDSIVFDTEPGSLLSVHSFQEDVSISVYPNPVSERLTITASSPINRIELYSMSAGLIDEIQFVTDIYLLDVSSVANGIYILKVNTSKGSYITKIVKN